jgi:hypothetical protein
MKEDLVAGVHCHEGKVIEGRGRRETKEVKNKVQLL